MNLEDFITVFISSTIVCVEPDIGADNPIPVTDIIVNGIVNLSSEETIAEQVDDFMSSVTPIEPESE